MSSVLILRLKDEEKQLEKMSLTESDYRDQGVIQHSLCHQTSHNVLSIWFLCRTINQKEEVVFRVLLF